MSNSSAPGSRSPGDLVSRIYREVLGEGTHRTRVVILHGWGQSLMSLLQLGRILASDFEVHLLDLPGFGRSPAPPTDWDTSDYAELIENYIEDGGNRPVVLLGHSFGGRVSVRLAAKRPDLVAAVVLIAAAGLPPIRTLRQKARLLCISALAWGIGWLEQFTGPKLRRWFRSRFASADDLASGELRGTFRKVIAEDLSVEASQIQSPTLLLWGDRDASTPLSMGLQYNGLISGSELIVLKGKDHFPFAGVGAQLCGFHVMKFLRILNPQERGV